jgi:hypothetical protein
VRWDEKGWQFFVSPLSLLLSLSLSLAHSPIRFFSWQRTSLHTRVLRKNYARQRRCPVGMSMTKAVACESDTYQTLSNMCTFVFFAVTSSVSLSELFSYLLRHVFSIKSLTNQVKDKCIIRCDACEVSLAENAW